LEGARAMAQFGRDYYAGRPAITEHRFGTGCAYYGTVNLTIPWNVWYHRRHDNSF